MIIRHKGDLVSFADKHNKNEDIDNTIILVHGCNLVGGFGAGIAGQIANTWPEVKANYMNNYSNRKLGNFDVVKVSDKLFVVNLYTQTNVRSRYNMRVASPAAIALGMSHILTGLSAKDNYEVHTVKIGSGLGGLDTEEVDDIYEVVTSYCNYDIHVWDF